jgi:hypothetical protein
MVKSKYLSKTEALEAFANMVNTFKIDQFLDLLDENFTYSSQTVFEEINSKKQFSIFIREKLKNLSDLNNKVYAELAELQPYSMSSLCGPCVVIAQGKKDNLVATVLLNVENNKITRLSFCIIPPPETTLRSGIYP